MVEQKKKLLRLSGKGQVPVRRQVLRKIVTNQIRELGITNILQGRRLRDWCLLLI